MNLTPDEVNVIKQFPEVKNIYPNFPVYATLMDAVPLINADDVWLLDENSGNCQETGRECLTGKGITIAILDTGVDYSHPDFGSCSAEQFLNSSCEKVIAGYDFVWGDDNPMDDHGHGTHVAATAAGNGVLKGVAPDAKIIAFKVLDARGAGTTAGIIAAIESVTDPNNDGDFSDHYDIMSMSLGGQGSPDDISSRAVDNAVESGVIAVIAAGNSGPYYWGIASPGAARKAITIGATYKKRYYMPIRDDLTPQEDQLTYFSSRGPTIIGTMKPDILAPGAIICAARYDSIYPYGENEFYKPCLDEEHVQLMGTSMATPVVSGAVALLKQKHPSWNSEDIKMALRNSAKKLGYAPAEEGYGRIDILSTIQLQQKPPIAEIKTAGYANKRENNNHTNISGTASGDNFTSYILEIGYGYDPSNWTLVCASSTPVVDGILCPNADISNLQDNEIYMLKLSVSNIENTRSVDKTIIWVNNQLAEREGFPINMSLTIGVGMTTDDIDYDGDKEILLTGHDSFRTDTRETQVYVIKNNGEFFAGWPKKFQAPPEYAANKSSVYTIMFGSISTGELDTNFYGKEIVFIQHDLNQTSGFGGHIAIHAVHLDGTYVEGWPKAISGEQYMLHSWTPVIKDLNNDGIDEIIIIGPDKRINIFNSDGTFFKYNDNDTWPVFIGGIDGTSLSPAVGDIDNDQEPEIVFGFYTSVPQCNDGIDNDGDGKIDFGNGPTNDPDCTSADDNMELTTPSPQLTSLTLNPTQAKVGDNVTIHGTSIMPLANERLVCGTDSGLSDVCTSSVINPYTQTGNCTYTVPSAIPTGNKTIYCRLQRDGIVSNEKTVILTINGSSPTNASILTSLNAGPTQANVGGMANQNTLRQFYMTAYNLDGTLADVNDSNGRPDWPRYVGTSNYNALASTPSMGDIDNDGNMEIMVSYRALLYVFNNDGTIKNGWPMQITDDERAGGFLYEIKSPSLADIDGDNFLEMFVTARDTSGSSVHAFRYNGSELNGWPIKLNTRLEASPVVADVDNDNDLDVVFNSLLSSIHGYDINGNNLFGFPIFLYEDSYSLAPIAIDDIDSTNGTNEIIQFNCFFTCNLHVINLDGKRKSWPMWQYNPQHTGSKDSLVSFGDPILTNIQSDKIKILQGETVTFSSVGYSPSAKRVKLVCSVPPIALSACQSSYTQDNPSCSWTVPAKTSPQSYNVYCFLQEENTYKESEMKSTTITVTVPPILSSLNISPTQTKIGDTVLIQGRSFLPLDNERLVCGTNSSLSDICTSNLINISNKTGSCTYTVPNATPTGNKTIYCRLQRDGMVSNERTITLTITFIPAPILSSLNVSSTIAYIGDTVLIQGLSFLPLANERLVCGTNSSLGNICTSNIIDISTRKGNCKYTISNTTPTGNKTIYCRLQRDGMVSNERTITVTIRRPPILDTLKVFPTTQKRGRSVTFYSQGSAPSGNKVKLRCDVPAIGLACQSAYVQSNPSCIWTIPKIYPQTYNVGCVLIEKGTDKSSNMKSLQVTVT